MERRSGNPPGVRLWLRRVDAHRLWQPWRSGSVPLPFWSTTTGEPDPFKTLNSINVQKQQKRSPWRPPPPLTNTAVCDWKSLQHLIKMFKRVLKVLLGQKPENVGLAAPAPVLWERQHFCPPRDNEMFPIWPRGRQIFRTRPARTKQSLNLWPSANISFAVFFKNASQHL